MKLSQSLKKEKFYRDRTNKEDILDEYWTIKLKDYSSDCGELNKYIYDETYTDLYVSVAGKESGVDLKALECAKKVIDELPSYLEEADKKLKLGPNNEGISWNLYSICFPYQVIDFWYLHFEDCYGNDIEYYFHKNHESEKYVGPSTGDFEPNSITDVMFTVKYVISELDTQNTLTDNLKSIKDQIKNN